MTLIAKMTDWAKQLSGFRTAVQEVHGVDAEKRRAIADAETEAVRYAEHLKSLKAPDIDA